MGYILIIYIFAVIGIIFSVLFIWYNTSDMLYKLKIKYILRPKFKKGDYVLVPDRNKKPILAQIESVYTDYKEKEINYDVRPTNFGNEYIDFEYFEQLCFDEECVFEVWKYCNIEIWDSEFAEKKE